MKKLLVVALLLLVSTGALAGPKEEAAKVSAKKWLKLIDAAQYEKSWDEAARLFQGAVKKGQWRDKVKGVRAPLGKLKAREVLSAKHITKAPGAPDGDYVVIQFKTSFENKKSAVETVTPMLDKKRGWRVSGYFIK